MHRIPNSHVKLGADTDVLSAKANWPLACAALDAINPNKLKINSRCSNLNFNMLSFMWRGQPRFRWISSDGRCIYKLTTHSAKAVHHRQPILSQCRPSFMRTKRKLMA
jgi:hypothetical protein